MKLRVGNEGQLSDVSVLKEDGSRVGQFLLRGEAEEVVKRVNAYERLNLELEQHKKQNSVFYDGGNNEDIYALQEENMRLKQWVNDLQSGMYVNCVYCGHRYGPEGETPTSMAEVLKEHIENCPNHPMSELKNQIKKLLGERHEDM